MKISNRGFSLVSVLIASGLTVTLAMALGEVLLQNSRSQKGLAQKYETIELRNTILNSFTDSKVCGCQFDSVTIDANTPYYNLVALKTSCDPKASVVAQTNTKLPGTQTGILVKEIALRDIEKISDKIYTGRLHVNFNPDSLVRPLWPVISNVRMNVEAGKVTTCRFTGGGPTGGGDGDGEDGNDPDNDDPNKLVKTGPPGQVCMKGNAGYSVEEHNFGNAPGAVCYRLQGIQDGIAKYCREVSSNPSGQTCQRYAFASGDSLDTDDRNLYTGSAEPIPEHKNIMCGAGTTFLYCEPGKTCGGGVGQDCVSGRALYHGGNGAYIEIDCATGAPAGGVVCTPAKIKFRLKYKAPEIFEAE